MKKIIVLFLAIALTVSLFGCGIAPSTEAETTVPEKMSEPTTIDTASYIESISYCLSWIEQQFHARESNNLGGVQARYINGIDAAKAKIESCLLHAPEDERPFFCQITKLGEYFQVSICYEQENLEEVLIKDVSKYPYTTFIVKCNQESIDKLVNNGFLDAKVEVNQLHLDGDESYWEVNFDFS